MNDVDEMNADPKLDAGVVGHAGIAFDHGVVDRDGAAYSLHDATEPEETLVASALNDATTMYLDSGVGEIAAHHP
ncbi:hypothetical protein CK219_10490 [Mesorhizobium sp. WSM4313]|nr:hypothetical protein CK219_10490 [Mesorhizobium sp. WSM4313]